MNAFPTLKRRSRDDSGQVLALFALALIVLLGMVALAVDGGYAYVQRRRVQYAADAAALAGAHVLTYGGTTADIDAAVRQYALANGADTYQWSLLSPTRIEVRTAVTFNTFFASVVGMSSMTARARSETEISGVSAVRGVMPIAARNFPYQYNQTYTLLCDQSEGESEREGEHEGEHHDDGSHHGDHRRSDSSHRDHGDHHDDHEGAHEGDHETRDQCGWLDWDGGSRGTRELAENICDPERSGLQRVGGWVWGAPGVRASAEVRSCLHEWIGKPMIIVLYDNVFGRGATTSYHIAGFAAFILEEYNFFGANKFIRGRFVRYVVPGVGGGPDDGLVTIQLGPN